jgi:hypothetical protein
LKAPPPRFPNAIGEKYALFGRSRLSDKLGLAVGRCYPHESRTAHVFLKPARTKTLEVSTNCRVFGLYPQNLPKKGRNFFVQKLDTAVKNEHTDNPKTKNGSQQTFGMA